MHFDSVFGYRDDSDLVCHWREGELRFGRFRQLLATTTAQVQQHLLRRDAAVALHCEDSGDFSLLLFAVLASGARAVIPANNKRVTMESLPGIDLWVGSWDRDDALSPQELLIFPVGGKVEPPPMEFTGAIQLFTSGSSGEPQQVEKTLEQLLTEIAVQQQHWGHLNADTTTLATVSHQHIYGLLFKVLWPLWNGCPFVGKTYVDVAALLRDAERLAPALWVASPAQLSRRNDGWPWQHGRSLRAIFSSGGPLSLRDAQHIETLCGQAPIEIYGSTETGGIAWRRQAEDSCWRPFSGVEVTCRDEDLIKVASPWLDGPFEGEDRLALESDGRFRLLGRADRIVKIEEKRISLSQLETLLCGSCSVEHARVLTIKRRRECVAAVVVLSAAGRDLLARWGKATLVRELRSFLAPDLDGVALPRLWRFVRDIPTNPQGKSPRELLLQVFEDRLAGIQATGMLPQVEHRALVDCGDAHDSVERAQVVAVVPEALCCLPGHFAEAPVVPGVVQIDWAMHYGRDLLGLYTPFVSMEVIKFKQLLRPGERVLLELEFNVEKNRLKFRFTCAADESQEYSSGRLCFDHG